MSLDATEVELTRIGRVFIDHGTVMLIREAYAQGQLFAPEPTKPHEQLGLEAA